MQPQYQWAWWIFIIATSVLLSPFFYIKAKRRVASATSWRKIVSAFVLLLLILAAYFFA